MEYISKTYGALHRGYKAHLEKIRKRLDLKREDEILEIGCAKGEVVRAVQEVAPKTHGIDVNPEAIASGVTRNLQVMSAEKLDFADESFDKAYSFHTIEHVPSPRTMLQEISRVVRPGGRVLLVYPAEPIRGLFSIVASFIIFKHPFFARRIHLHKFTPKKIEALLEGTKLQQVESGFSLRKGPEFFTLLRKGV